MQRIAAVLVLTLALAALAPAAATAQKPKAPAAPPPSAAPALPEGFDVEAFRRNFAAGLVDRPNAPALGPQAVLVDQAEKAATLGNMDIYAVKGRLAPEGGPAQPFLLFISADGQFHVSDLVSLRAGKSVLKETRERMRQADLKGFGHTILKGKAGKPVVVFVSDPFCYYCRQAFALLMERRQAYSELKLAHFPLSSHPGADIACALLVWAEAKAPKKLMDFVRFAYTELAAPEVEEKTPENLTKAWNQVAAAFLAKFPELKALGKTPEAIVAALGDSPHARAVAEDMARGVGMEITGTPVIFVDQTRVSGFDEERLAELLK